MILNGVAVSFTPQEAAAMEMVPGVRKVLRDTIETIDTDAGPSWIGAPTLWDGTAVPDGMMTKGEGIVAGILDTGINFDHPSFSETPADGYTYPTPASTWAFAIRRICPSTIPCMTPPATTRSSAPTIHGR